MKLNDVIDKISSSDGRTAVVPPSEDTKGIYGVSQKTY